MNIIYTGGNSELLPAQQQKLDAKFQKVAKLVDTRGNDKEVHVIITMERHLHNAEITVNYYDHTLVGVASDADEFTALCGAVDKLEKQILRHREKWRDTNRAGRNGAIRTEAAAGGQNEAAAEPAGPRVFRVDATYAGKPKTLEEALLELEDGREYLVYRDTDSNRLQVLLRRSDGNFDLIEA